LSKPPVYKPTKVVMRPVKRRAVYRTTGSYKGKFRKGRNSKSPFTKYIAKGFVHTTEVNGTLGDPDVLYVGHSAISGAQALEFVAMSLLRKLLWDISRLSIDNVVTPLYGIAGSAVTYQFNLYTTNPDTIAEAQISYNTVASDSIFTIVGNVAGGVTGTWSGLMTALQAYATGASEAMPTRLEVAKLDFSTLGTTYRILGQLNLMNTSCHLYSESELKIQNRTLGADASADATDVTNNPLVGRSYQFRGGVPYIKTNNIEGRAVLLDRMLDNTGSLLARGASFTHLAYREPIEPKMFVNCVKSSKIRLEPGAIKMDKLNWKKSMAFLKFIKLIYSDTRIGNNYTLNIPGKCSIIALEDIINVNAAQNIALAYEINRKVGVYLTTGKVPAAIGQLYQITLNDP